jgi:hypothetical protein
MSRLAALGCALAVLASACGGAPAATQPSPTASAAATKASLLPLPTQAPTIYSFIAELKAVNEIPPIADAEANCTGQARISLSVLIDPSYYNVTSGKASFDVSLSGCPQSTQLVLAHIHQGTATQNGPVKVDTGLVATQPIAFVGGVAAIKKADVSIEPAVADDVIANPGNYYFNVHSQAHGGGVVRGQLVASR